MLKSKKYQIPAGYLSRNQIIEKYGVSQASLTKYIENSNFPLSIPQHIKGIGRHISTFKENEVAEWFAYKHRFIESGVVHQKLDIALSLRFLRGQL